MYFYICFEELFPSKCIRNSCGNGKQTLSLQTPNKGPLHKICYSVTLNATYSIFHNSHYWCTKYKTNSSNTFVFHIQLFTTFALHNQLNALWCKDACNKYFFPLKASGIIFFSLFDKFNIGLNADSTKVVQQFSTAFFQQVGYCWKASLYA